MTPYRPYAGGSHACSPSRSRQGPHCQQDGRLAGHRCQDEVGVVFSPWPSHTHCTVSSVQGRRWAGTVCGSRGRRSLSLGRETRIPLPNPRGTALQRAPACSPDCCHQSLSITALAWLQSIIMLHLAIAGRPAPVGNWSYLRLGIHVCSGSRAESTSGRIGKCETTTAPPCPDPSPPLCLVLSPSGLRRDQDSTTDRIRSMDLAVVHTRMVSTFEKPKRAFNRHCDNTWTGIR